jgi:hypothetical protein
MISGHEIGGVAIFSRNVKEGTLHQLKGKAGCVSARGSSEDGPGTCTRAREVDSVSSLHLSPDQKFLYASDYDSPPDSGIAIFARSSKSGMLHQLSGRNGCLTDNGTTLATGSRKVCGAMPNLSDPWDVATPDNRFAYIPAADSEGKGGDLVQAFDRNAKGGLVPLKGKGSCVSDSGTSPARPCVHGRGLFRPERAVTSKNGRFLYINSFGQGTGEQSPVAVLTRNPKTGRLSQRPGSAACISANGTSGDGKTCQDGRALDGGYAGSLAPDGSTLYFAENAANALVIFRVSPKSGAFHQLPGKLGCVTPDGSSEDGPDTCQKGRSLAAAYQVALGSDGRDVYVSAGVSVATGKGVALFHTAP